MTLGDTNNTRLDPHLHLFRFENIYRLSDPSNLETMNLKVLRNKYVAFATVLSTNEPDSICSLFSRCYSPFDAILTIPLDIRESSRSLFRIAYVIVVSAL